MREDSFSSRKRHRGLTLWAKCVYMYARGSTLAVRDVKVAWWWLAWRAAGGRVLEPRLVTGRRNAGGNAAIRLVRG